MNKPKSYCLVLSYSTGYGFAVATTILSFLETNDSWFKGDIVIYYQKKDASLFLLLKRVYPRIFFIKYKFPNHKPLLSYSYWRFSKMVFARIEALNLLRSYDVIIGTDFDVIFKKSILSDVLMNKTMTALGGQVFNSHYFHLTQEEKEYQNKQGFSMGFYIINRVLCDQLVSTDLYSYYLRRCFSIRLPEQACFNFYQQKNQIDVTYLNSSYASNELRSDTVILHSRPNEKFWENLDPEWVIIYEKYISLGGRAMQAKILTRTRSRRKLAMLLHLFSIRLKRKFA